MPEDKWGIPMWYASSTRNPFFYQQSNKPENDSNLGGKDDINFGSGEEFSIHINGPTSFFVQRDPNFTDSIGGCDMSFSDSESRGYTHKSNDLRDVEYKCLIKITGGDGDNTASISGPTGHHTSDHCCQGFSYMFNFSYTDSTPKFRFRKEMWHVSYHDHSTGEWTNSKANFKISGHGYVGIGYVRYNKKNGRSTGHDSVILEGWFNPNPESDIKNWTMLRRIEDKGGWGDDGDDCDGLKDQVGTWGGEHFRIKSNDSDADFTIKHLSLREIDPLLSFDDNPEAPPPPTTGGGGTTTISTITGTFKFMQDINTIRSSACAGAGTGGGGGGETGNAMFYDVEDTSGTTELSDTSTFQNRTRVGEQCTNSSSPMKGNVINQLDVWLKKVGSPNPADKIFAKLYSSSGATRYTSPTQIDPSTLTTSFTKKTFDFSANTLSINTGDVVAVNWGGTSSTDYVVVAYGDKVIDNCTYVNYESGSWEPKTTSRDFAAIMWE